MPISRILILAAASFAFLAMVATVGTNSDFVYAPESTWKISADAGEDVAVAAWRSRTSASVTASARATIDTDESSRAARASSAASSVVSSAAASSAASVADEASSSSTVSSDDGGDVPAWGPDWWPDFGDDRDGGRDGHRKKGKDRD